MNDHQEKKNNNNSSNNSNQYANDDNNDNHDESKNRPDGASVRARSRKNRVYVMRQFLLDTYAADLNPAPENPSRRSRRPIVLDVAGGKGDLSWLLNNSSCNNNKNGKKNTSWDAVVVDPRPTQHDHLIRSIHYLQSHPRTAQERAIPHRSGYQPLAELVVSGQLFDQAAWSSISKDDDDDDENNNDEKNNNEETQPPRQQQPPPPLPPPSFVTPRHLKIYVNDELVQVVRQVRRQRQEQLSGTSNPKPSKDERGLDTWSIYWKQALQRAGNQGNADEPVVEGPLPNDASQSSLSSTTGTTGTSSTTTQKPIMIVNAQDALETILNARLIVGFHPDQATDACIDLANELHIPFCVVPCCVFPSEFPHRRFIDYTCQPITVRTFTPSSPSLSLPSPPTEAGSVTAALGPARDPVMEAALTDRNHGGGGGGRHHHHPQRRKIKNDSSGGGQGRPVQLYHQLIDYLRQQTPLARMATLSFYETTTARNIVLYTLPADYHHPK